MSSTLSKLWIVHRAPAQRNALARLAGLPADEILAGEPGDPRFAEAAPPTALLLAPLSDFEHELDFVHRHRASLTNARRLFLVEEGDAAEVARLFEAGADELAPARPTARMLRDFVLSARAHRRAEPLAARRERERVAERFAHWFGTQEIPGLLRALDPALASLPLLVRGVPGSGRGLVLRYLELFRVHGTPGRVLSLDAQEIPDLETLGARLDAVSTPGLPAYATVRIEEVDALAAATQRALAEWMRLGPQLGSGHAPLRWTATASPAGLQDRVEAGLAAAFAPLVLQVPSLLDAPATLRPFADQVIVNWSLEVGGPPRRLADDATEILEAQAWAGDRAAVEGLLRTALAASSDPVLDLATLEESAWALGLAQAPIASAPSRNAEAATLGSWPEDTETPDAPEPLAPFDPFPETSSSPVNPHGADAPLRQRFADAPVVSASSPAADLSAERTPTATLTPAPATREARLESSLVTAELERAFQEGGAAAAPDEANVLADLPPTADVSVALGSALFTNGNGGEHGAANVAAASPSGVAPTATAGPNEARSSGPVSDPAEPARWRRLARSLSHEIRNPLVSIRTFAQLLPDHFEDPDFRARFTELVGRDVAHIDEVVGRLADAAATDAPQQAEVDVSAMLERLLEDRRDAIGRRRLLVLRELERDDPVAWVDARSLDVALAGLLDRALASLPERGDLFVATRRIDAGPDGRPQLRVLLRHHDPSRPASDAGGPADVQSAANVIEYVLAETILDANAGQLTIDETDGQETLVLVDLPTPDPDAPTA